MSEAVGILGAQADLFQQVVDAVGFFLFGKLKVDIHALGDDLADGHTGVQGSVGVLEDDLRVLFELQQFFAVQVGDILPVELDGTGGGVVELDEGTAAGGFTAAGLAHQAQGLAAADGQVDVIHGFQGLFGASLKVFAQVGGFDDIFREGCFFVCHSYFASLS